MQQLEGLVPELHYALAMSCVCVLNNLSNPNAKNVFLSLLATIFYHFPLPMSPCTSLGKNLFPVLQIISNLYRGLIVEENAQNLKSHGTRKG